MNVHRPMPPPTQISPRLVIIEQPKQRGMRFRYLCEGRSAGSIPGENTTTERKTWPSVQIQNYHGEVTIRVSLVSNDKIPRPHPHSLVGKDCSDGICTVRVTPETQMTATFSNLGVQCVKRKEVTDALRTRQRLQVDPFNSAQSNQQTTDIDLNVVILCFEAFINQGDYHYVIQPVLSNPIFDKKATGSALLRICRVDRSFGSCKGGDEVYLLCDKVQKDDITICFYDVETGWEAYGEFSPTDVHRQVAIVFRTPAYKDQNILQATKVLFQLRRGSDHETSESKEFTYLPSHHAQPHLVRGPKRKFDQDAKAHLNELIRSKVRVAPPGQYGMFPPPMPPFYPPGMPQPLPFPPMDDYRMGLRHQPSPQVQPPVGPPRLHQPRTTQPMSNVSPIWNMSSMPRQSDINQQPTMTQLQDFSSTSQLLEMANFSPAVPSQNPEAVEGYEETSDSIASFKDIDTTDINTSIKQMSLEPMDVSTVKTEQNTPLYFPRGSCDEVRPVVSPMGNGLGNSSFSPVANFTAVAQSPEQPSYHVPSPSYNQQVTASVVPSPPYNQQVTASVVPSPSYNQQVTASVIPPSVLYNHENLNSLTVDPTERLPSYDLTQHLPSDALDDF